MVEKYVSNEFGSNVFVVSNGSSCIIIDAGVKLDKIQNAVKNRNVEGILLTHAHYDHAMYVSQYQNAFGCKVYASAGAKEYLKNADFNGGKGRLLLWDFSNFVFLQNNGTVKVGSFDVEYKTLGGHTKSDMAFFVQGDIFVGDIVIERNIGRTDLYGGDKSQMKESLKTILNSQYKIMHCGHGGDYDKSTQDVVVKNWLEILNK